MGRRHDTYIVFIAIYGKRPAHCPRSKPSLLHPNFNRFNLHEHKAKTNKMENGFSRRRTRHCTEQSYGAKISVALDTNRLKLYFGIFLAIIAVIEIITLFKQNKKEKNPTK